MLIQLKLGNYLSSIENKAKQLLEKFKVEKVATIAAAKLIEKLIDIAFEHVKFKRKRIWPLSKLSKPSNIVIVEYMASTNSPISSSDDSSLLRGILESTGVRLMPLDLSSLSPDIANLVFDKWKGTTIDLVFTDNDICWIVVGHVERYRDIFEDIPTIRDFEEFIEMYENAEENVKEELGESYADLVYMFSYIIIPVTKKSIYRTYELVDKIHWTLNKTLEVRATIKLRIFGERPKKMPKDTTMYDMEDHVVVIVYNPYTLKEILEEL